MIKKFLKNMVDYTGYRLIKKDFLHSFYHRSDDPQYRRSGDLRPLEQLFYRYIAEDFFFIQETGRSNNGRRYDPIHPLLSQEKDRVKGTVIEPVDLYSNELPAADT